MVAQKKNNNYMPKYIVPYHIQFDQNACRYLILVAQWKRDWNIRRPFLI
jgi:hypothetical protein